MALAKPNQEWEVINHWFVQQHNVPVFVKEKNWRNARSIQRVLFYVKVISGLGRGGNRRRGTGSSFVVSMKKKNATEDGLQDSDWELLFHFELEYRAIKNSNLMKLCNSRLGIVPSHCTSSERTQLWNHLLHLRHCYIPEWLWVLKVETTERYVDLSRAKQNSWLETDLAHL